MEPALSVHAGHSPDLVLEVSLEHIDPPDADLALARRGEVLHAGHVLQPDHVAGERRPHVSRLDVSRQRQGAGGGALGEAITLHHDTVCKSSVDLIGLISISKAFYLMWLG